MDSEIVITSGVRTPIGKFGGSLKTLTAVEMGAVAVEQALKRSRIESDAVAHAWVGMARQAGNGPNPGKLVAVQGGMPYHVPVTTIQMACVSGLQAGILAYYSLLAGDGDVALVAGVEHMSSIPYLLCDHRWGRRMGDSQVVDAMTKDGFLDPMTNETMGSIADSYSHRWGISREEQDVFALNSHRKAAKAWDSGAYKDSVVPLTIPGRTDSFTMDEHYRRDISLEKLARLKGAFHPDGTVSAGNASGITDGACAYIMMTARMAHNFSLRPLARIIGVATASLDPRDYGVAPMVAVRKALQRAEIALDRVDIWEINEAFAVQVLAMIRELDIDVRRVNPFGGAIALGHPIGMSGARIVLSAATGLHHLNARYAVATLCGNGGQGGAVVLERV